MSISPSINITISAKNEAAAALQGLTGDVKAAYAEIQQSGTLTDAAREKWQEARKELVEHQKVQSTLKMAYREQHEQLTMVANAMSQVGAVVGKVQTMYQQYNTAMIRVNQLESDRVSLQDKLTESGYEVKRLAVAHTEAMEKYGMNSKEATKALDEFNKAHERRCKIERELEETNRKLAEAQQQNTMMMVGFVLQAPSFIQQVLKIKESIVLLKGAEGFGGLASSIGTASGSLTGCTTAMQGATVAAGLTGAAIAGIAIVGVAAAVFFGWLAKEGSEAMKIVRTESEQTQKQFTNWRDSLRDDVADMRGSLKSLSEGVEENAKAWQVWEDTLRDELKEARREAKALRDDLVGASIFPEMMSGIINVTEAGMKTVQANWQANLAGMVSDAENAATAITEAAASIVFAPPLGGTGEPGMPTIPTAGESWWGKVSPESPEAAAWAQDLRKQAEKYVAQTPLTRETAVKLLQATEMIKGELHGAELGKFLDLIPSGTVMYSPSIQYFGLPPEQIFPTYQYGGIVKETGLALVHKGEPIGFPSMTLHIHIAGDVASRQTIEQITEAVNRGIAEALRRLYR